MAKWRRQAPKDFRKLYAAAAKNAHEGGAKTFGSIPETKTWKCPECGNIVMSHREKCDCGAKKPPAEPTPAQPPQPSSE